MFKYELNSVVYYLINNEFYSAPILSRMIIENLHDNWNVTKAQKDLYNRFGQSGIFYGTVHGNFKQEEVFLSKEDLCESLIKK